MYLTLSDVEICKVICQFFEKILKKISLDQGGQSQEDDEGVWRGGQRLKNCTTVV